VLVDLADIPGCVLVDLRLAHDDRGDFVKLYQRSRFAADGMDPTIAEVFLSRSAPGVVRGLHFQSPPHDHAKTVSCLQGSVVDVVVDLRVDSPTYAHHACVVLDGAAPAALHVPRGCAHGFQATADAWMAYLVSTEHAPDHDTGIRWDSAGIAWPIPEPVVSERDRALPALPDFVSPFRL